MSLCVLGSAGCFQSASRDKAGGAVRLDVSYFHRTARCPSCILIETWTRETIEKVFTKEMAEGRVTWRAVNLDLPENSAYADAYELTTSSVILSRVVGEKEVQWKNLEGVWDLLDKEAEFRSYIEKEARSFLTEPAADSTPEKAK